jgi:hypothetical protein
MYVVQPPWLSKIGVFPQGTKVAIWSKFDEPGFRYQPENLPMRWSVTPGRIEVESDSLTEDCGSRVAEVLSKLPWTPLIAIGNNAVYEATLSELEEIPGLSQFNPAMPEGYELFQRSFHLGAAHGNQQFNLQLSVMKELIEISVNANTDLAGKESVDAQMTARSFFEHRTQSESLIANLLKVSVVHADGNSEQVQGGDGTKRK